MSGGERHTEEALKAMSRREIQSLAMQNGLKANLTSLALIEMILAAQSEEHNQGVDDVSELAVISTPPTPLTQKKAVGAAHPK